MSLVAFPGEGTAEPAEEDVCSLGFEQMPMVMSPKTLGLILEVSLKTLERWRDAKSGPAWHKLPGSSLIRYSRADVLSWFAACREAEAAS